MIKIYTGHHLNSVITNIKLVISSLDAPETIIQKATDVFEQSKDAPVIIRTNDILFLDTIKASTSMMIIRNTNSNLMRTEI